MYVITYLPIIIVFFVGELCSLEKAFLRVYLPCLLLIAPEFQAHISGLPDLNFAQAAILPLGLMFMVHRVRHWRVSFLDILVVTFVLWYVISDYHNNGAKQALSTAFFASINFIFPYMLAKGLLRNDKINIQFAKTFVFLLFLNIIDLAHSLIFNWSIQDRIFRPFFPGTEHATWFHKRLGLPRIPVSFAHPISAGIGMAIGYRVSKYLEWTKHWEKRFRYWHPLNISKSKLLRWGLLLMLVMTFSRGPWIAAVIGAFFAQAAVKMDPKRSLFLRIFVFLVAIPFIWLALEMYVSTPTSELQGTVRYRWDLLGKYSPFIALKPIFGWGTVDWPFGHSLRSVDNHYLYLIVLRGWVGFTIFVSLLGTICFRLLFRALNQRKSKVKGGGLVYTFLAVYVIYIVSMTSVWLSPKNFQIFFLITGWAEAFLLSKKIGIYSKKATALEKSC